MTGSSLPQNVYNLMQKEFSAIPGRPLIYWLNHNLRNLFERFPLLSEVGVSKVGINTGHNERFVRWHWEVSVKSKSSNWQPYVSGGPKKRYYGNLFYFLNWSENEIKEYPGSALRAREYQGKEGITYGLIGSGKPAFRYLPSGYMFSSGGNCIFMDDVNDLLALLGILNSSVSTYLLKIINPTINLSVGDILRLPVAKFADRPFSKLVLKATRISKYQDCTNETSIDFTIPTLWSTGQQDLLNLAVQIQKLDYQINNEVFSLYSISAEDRTAIEVELTGEMTGEEEEQIISNDEESELVEVVSSMTQQELATRWISFAVGFILGCFRLGVEGGLGSAIYRRSDFAIGSLPAPDETEFDELVGPTEKFSYVDGDGRRHVFPAQVEKALQSLALTDGIAVFDEGHPHDLPALVEKALMLMLGEQSANEVISAGADGNLRKFLEKEYFTKYHVRWYRSRPIYWYIQSSKRSYGFIIFHEKISKDTLYAIQREPYLDTKRNAVNLEMQDVQARVKQSAGGERKKLEKRLAELRDLAEELSQFAKDLEEITRNGYEPEPDWIDDGVILRMAPLWKVIPLWKNEPKKYWERLEAGDFDWSHIAIKYWPKRVREKCKKNKSFAIAHGHEEWYEG